MTHCLFLRSLLLRNNSARRFPQHHNLVFPSLVSTRSVSTLPRLTVSIVGPPNAGKSTLFNQFLCKESNKSYRLSTEKKKLRSNGRIGYSRRSRNYGGAIVSSTAGTTRDRRECIGRIGGTYFNLIDTAGVDGERLLNAERKAPSSAMERAMLHQTMLAAKQSDLILLIFDARIGVTSDLSLIAKWLRKQASPPSSSLSPSLSSSPNRVVLLGNKLEGDRWSIDPESGVLQNLKEAARIGFGDVIPISAIHKDGLADVAVKIEEMMRHKFGDLHSEQQPEPDNAPPPPPLKFAILGRQNVGKSTLLNALLRQERVITGPTPGLTRDAISIAWEYNSKPIQLVDTAGIRKISQRNHHDTIEDKAVQDAIRAMKTADVAALIIDAEARYLQRQELAIADAVIREGRALLLVVNKMDKIVDEQYTQHTLAQAVQNQLEIRFPMLRKTPVIAMSSLNGQGVNDLLPQVFRARERWAQTISTGVLNRWLEEVLDENAPPMHHNRTTKIKYIMQTKGRPPTFLLFCNVDTLPVSYLRYLTRNFQDTFQMFGMEVRMAVKKSTKDNPYYNGKTRKGSGLGGREGKKKRLVGDLKSFGRKQKRRMRK